MQRKRASFKQHNTARGGLTMTQYQNNLNERLRSVNAPTLKPDDYDNLADAFHKHDPDEDYSAFLQTKF